MPESSTNVEPKGKKENLKRRNSASQNEHVEANVEVVDGAVGAKTELQELTALLKQGFAQMSQDLSKTIAVFQTVPVFQTIAVSQTVPAVSGQREWRTCSFRLPFSSHLSDKFM